MTDLDMLREALKVGPLVAALGFIVWVLWKRLGEKDAAVQLLTREVLTALAANTAAVGHMASAIDGLREAMERSDHRATRRGGAD